MHTVIKKPTNFIREINLEIHKSVGEAVCVHQIDNPERCL